MTASCGPSPAPRAAKQGHSSRAGRARRSGAPPRSTARSSLARGPASARRRDERPVEPSGSSSLVAIVRADRRSTPRMAVAASAMSAIRNVISSWAGSVDLRRADVGQPLQRRARRRPDQLARLARVQVLGGEAADGALDDDGLDGGRERARLVGRRLVARDQHDRDAVVQRDESVQRALADDVAVQLASRSRSGCTCGRGSRARARSSRDRR